MFESYVIPSITKTEYTAEKVDSVFESYVIPSITKTSVYNNDTLICLRVMLFLL